MDVPVTRFTALVAVKIGVLARRLELRTKNDSQRKNLTHKMILVFRQLTQR
jgi:hypothetical protein